MPFLHTVPDPPSGVHVNDTGSMMVTIAWQAPVALIHSPISGVLYYHLLLSESQFGKPDMLINTTDTFFTFAGLEEYNTYTCTIAAVNGVGRGMFSNPINFTTLEEGKVGIYCHKLSATISSQHACLLVTFQTA